MLLIAIIIGFGLGSLLLRKRALLEGSTTVIEPARLQLMESPFIHILLMTEIEEKGVCNNRNGI